MVKDLTTGKELNRILGFSIPILLGNLFQQLYNMTDSIIVGQFVSKNAFAAVGSTGAINFLIIGFILGVSSGVCIPIAQQYGAGNMKAMRKKIATAIYVVAGVGLVLTVVTVFGTDALLHLMKTPDNIFGDARTFIRIIFIGIPGIILYNLPANISRALGDSKTPLYFLVLSVILNAFLALFLVYFLHMGVAGSAIATVISQMLAGILCILYMKKKYEILVFEKDEWAFEPKSAYHSMGVGVPMGLQFSITAIGSVVIQSAVNTLGSDTVAAVNVAMKIQMVFVQPLEALGVTMATFCGQNLGAGKISRISEGMKKALTVSVLFSIVIAAVILPLEAPLSSLFMKKSEMTPMIQADIHQILLYNSVTYFLLGTLLVLRNAIQGLGHSVVAMGAGIFEMVARCMIAFLAVAPLGYTAICFANPAAWVGANLILVPMFLYFINRLKAQEASGYYRNSSDTYSLVEE